jgi:hypothetical protein
VGPIRSVVAAAVLVGSLAGCAAGLHDETSSERSTPYLGGAVVGGLKVRDVAVVPTGASLASASPYFGTEPSSSPASDTGQTQGMLTMVVVNDGNAPDSITDVQVGNGGGVTPTDPTISGTIEPGQSLIFGAGAQAGSTTPANDLSISGLSGPLVPGTTVKVTVTFQNAGQVTVQAPVLSAPGA